MYLRRLVRGAMVDTTLQYGDDGKKEVTTRETEPNEFSYTVVCSLCGIVAIASKAN
jgi:hypothetical protein